MRFGLLHSAQIPKPWQPGDEERLFANSLAQVELADRLGIDYVWAVEHHFLEEYSHSSSPEVFLAACAARTSDIRLGHGIRHTPPPFNHPARTAESVATLDLISGGRVDLGIGEGATRLELGAFAINAKEKRAMSLEAGEQIANMLAMEPYPGFEGEYFSMPCRNIVPKPVQKPHPPMWIACTNRDTIELAASRGLGALAFAFLDPGEATHWVKTYYDIVKSDECVPLGHTVNANVAVVTGLMVHEDRAEALRRGHDGFQFFRYALESTVVRDTTPGRTQVWDNFVAQRGDGLGQAIDRARGAGSEYAASIGTPDDVRRYLRAVEETGVDQVIFLIQSGRNDHEQVCESLELFAREVMPEFHDTDDERKRMELAPHVEAALARKQWLPALPDDEIPVVEASVKRVQVPIYRDE